METLALPFPGFEIDNLPRQARDLTNIKGKLDGKLGAARYHFLSAVCCLIFCFACRAGGALLYYPMQPNGQISEQTLQVRYISIIALFS
eukprot:COSAG06_NODE_6408_length_2945_cov_4.018974_2_plen_89_part_00